MPIGHHFSHRVLLSWARPRRTRYAAVDGIIVPSARPAEYIRHAAGLAAALDCTLIVLASKKAERQAIRAGVSHSRLHVYDVPAVIPHLPVLRTSLLLRREGLHRPTDVSAKRNLGLAVARMAGLTNVLYLDDDVRIPNTRHLRVGAGLLNLHYAVGLRSAGYPDNSVVCHANRLTGGEQDTFVGGGALMINAREAESFFPDIYNEDWFFLLSEHGIRPVTLTGSAVQKAYDPFINTARARAEEFGDVLAEGLFALLDDEKTIKSADETYWRHFIKSRRDLIGNILRRIRENQKLEKSMRKRMIASLLASRDQLDKRIKPALCVEFMNAWQQDVVAWKSFQRGLPSGLGVESAFNYFDLHDRIDASERQLMPVRERNLALSGFGRLLPWR